MKNFSKLLSLLLVLTALFTSPLTSGAQTVYTLPLVAGDTVVNTATVSKTFIVSGDYKGIVVSPRFAKIAGTVAGTIKLQASVKGVIYTDVASQTFTATDVASNSTNWYVVAPLARYYKVTWTGSGTMSAVLGVDFATNR